jgi:hypothetical protein
MTIVYTAGPYKQIEGCSRDQNIRNAQLVAAKLWDMGYTVICPHMNTADFENLTSLTNKDFVYRDLEIVQFMDAIVMLPEWEHSRGAVKEKEHAEEWGVAVFYWPDVPEEEAFLDTVYPDANDNINGLFGSVVVP